MKYYKLVMNGYVKEKVIFCKWYDIGDFYRYSLECGNKIDIFPKVLFEFDSDEGNVISDYGFSVLAWPIFSERLISLISEYLTEDNVQLFPIQFYDRKKKMGPVNYYAVNIIDVLEGAVNYDYSKYINLSGKKSVTVFALNQDVIEGHDIFRVKDSMFSIFISERIYKIMKKNKMIGFDYEYVGVIGPDTESAFQEFKDNNVEDESRTPDSVKQESPTILTGEEHIDNKKEIINMKESVFGKLGSMFVKKKEPETGGQYEFVAWLDKVCGKEWPKKTVALCFNLYEDMGNKWSIELVGSSEYDEDNEDWPCSETFATRENCFVIEEKNDWEHIEKKFEGWLKGYLQTGKCRDRLKSYKAIAIGFVDGDLNILFHK